MPNSPKTPTRTFRCPNALWDAAKDKAARQEPPVTVTQVILEALEKFVADE